MASGLLEKRDIFVKKYFIPERFYNQYFRTFYRFTTEPVEKFRLIDKYKIPNSFSTYSGEYYKDVYLDNKIIGIKE